jgi:ribokinase
VTESPQRIVVIGDAMIDYTVVLSDPHAAEHGRIDEKRTVARSTRALGGTGANAAATLVLAGDRVELLTTVSDDAYGEWIVEHLGAAGVGTAGVRSGPGSPPHATIVLGAQGVSAGTDDDDRLVLVDRGVTDAPLALADHELGGADLVYVSNPYCVELPLAEAALRPQPDDHGGDPDRRLPSIVLGLEAEMFATVTAEMVDGTIAIVNEAAWYLGAETLGAAELVVETRGKAGAIVHSGPDEIRVEGIPVEVVNATGAGDAFAATFCHYLARGLDVIGATERACIVGALAAGSAESALRHLDLDEIEARWRAQYGQNPGDGNDERKRADV